MKSNDLRCYETSTAMERIFCSSHLQSESTDRRLCIFGLGWVGLDFDWIGWNTTRLRPPLSLWSLDSFESLDPFLVVPWTKRGGDLEGGFREKSGMGGNKGHLCYGELQCEGGDSRIWILSRENQDKGDFFFSCWLLFFSETPPIS